MTEIHSFTVAVSPNPNPLSFQFEGGMIWSQFYDSEYNTNSMIKTDLTSPVPFVSLLSNGIFLNNCPCLPEDKIQSVSYQAQKVFWGNYTLNGNPFTVIWGADEATWSDYIKSGLNEKTSDIIFTINGDGFVLNNGHFVLDSDSNRVKETDIIQDTIEGVYTTEE